MPLTRRNFLRAGSVAALAAGVACDRVPLPKSLTSLVGPPERPSKAFQPPTSETLDLVSHCLNRATYGVRPGDYERVRKLGASEEEAVTAFIEEQLQPEKIDDSFSDYTIRRFETLDLPLGELFEYQEHLLLAEMCQATILRAALSERQLYEVMVGFWSDHFNIDPSKGDSKWLKVADDREVIRKFALKNFSNLLEASAKSPAMLWYLDGRVNRKATPADKPNENYARELMELHTLGVHGGYTQKDVMEVARCLTGWTVNGTHSSKFGLGDVEFKLHLHDKGEKIVLGEVIPAIPETLSAREQSRLGEYERDRVLQILSLHPATGRYLATKLCRHFIADEPSAGAVKAVADAFVSNGGDIPATLRALFATEDFRQSRGNKFKRPFHFVVSSLRATDAHTNGDAEELMTYLQRMGHAPFHYPTPDGFPEEAGHWLGTLLWRWNFAVALNEEHVKGTRVPLKELTANAGGDSGLLAHLLGRKPAEAELQAYHESGAGLALALASPAFQRC